MQCISVVIELTPNTQTSFNKLIDLPAQLPSRSYALTNACQIWTAPVRDSLLERKLIIVRSLLTTSSDCDWRWSRTMDVEARSRLRAHAMQRLLTSNDRLGNSITCDTVKPMTIPSVFAASCGEIIHHTNQGVTTVCHSVWIECSSSFDRSCGSMLIPCRWYAGTYGSD